MSAPSLCHALRRGTELLDCVTYRRFERTCRERAAWGRGEEGSSLRGEGPFGHSPVRANALVDGHAQPAQHDSYDSAAVSVGVSQAATTYPPVLVPPIMSKRSQGRGTSVSPSASRMRSMRCSRMSRLESPRIPPPSADVSRFTDWRVSRLTQRENSDSITRGVWIHHDSKTVAGAIRS